MVLLDVKTVKLKKIIVVFILSSADTISLFFNIENTQVLGNFLFIRNFNTLLHLIILR